MSSQDNTSNNKRIAKNTIMLYLRMFLTMIVGLYTSRVVLATLGVEDYGVYGVVGGVVSMMGFLNASMSGATSRFLTFELGRGDKERLAKMFSSAMVAHLIIAAIVLVVAETVGLWFLCTQLNIPEGRMFAAHVVYQLSIFSAMFGITQVPYNSSIISHEKMDIYAYVEILNVTLKLLIVYLLVIGSFDKLILYAILTLAVSLFIMMVYRVYCIRHFDECHFHFVWEKEYLKPLMSFSGWEVFGHFGFTFRTQGTNIALNMVYGTIANAAAGLAATVQGILQGFSQNVITAIRPQIIKRYAAKEYDSMANLMYSATRISIFFASVTCIPVLIKIKYILAIWLVDVPQYCVVFCQYMLLSNIVSSVSQISYIGLQANGDIKYTSLCRNIIYVLTPIIIWFGMHYFSYPPQFAYICIFISQIILMTIDIILVRHYLPFYNIVVYIPIIVISTIAILITVFASKPLLSVSTSELANFVATLLASILVLTSSFYVLVFTKRERQLVNSYVKKIIKRI